MSPVLPIAAVSLLAALGLRRSLGSRAVDAYKTLRESAESQAGDIKEFYPDTASGLLEPGPREEVFWAGLGRRRIGYIGPSDGTMVPIDARYLVPTQLNIFSMEKLGALASAVRQGREPLVRAGFADVSLVDKLGVKEGLQYRDDIFTELLGRPYEDKDIGALAGRMRDGNHRSFAALVAGAPFTWVQVSDRSLQDIFQDTPSARRLYREIRRAQADAYAPQLTKPKRRKGQGGPGPRATSRSEAGLRGELREAEMELLKVKGEIEYAYKELLKSFHRGGRVRLPLHEQLENPEMFLRKRLEQAMAERDQALLDRYWEDPLSARLDLLEGQSSTLWSKIWDAKVKLGIDPRGAT